MINSEWGNTHTFCQKVRQWSSIRETDIQHHTNYPCAVKNHFHPKVKQLKAPFKQAYPLAHCNSIDNKGCKQSPDSSDLQQFCKMYLLLNGQVFIQYANIVCCEPCCRKSETRGPFTLYEASNWMIPSWLSSSKFLWQLFIAHNDLNSKYSYSLIVWLELIEIGTDLMFAIQL